jgi:hypothetical protein
MNSHYADAGSWICYKCITSGTVALTVRDLKEKVSEKSTECNELRKNIDWYKSLIHEDSKLETASAIFELNDKIMRQLDIAHDEIRRLKGKVWYLSQ